MTDFVKTENDIKQIIDDLKGLCSQNGLSNQADEEEIITSVFLYKFLNDKFTYNLSKFADEVGIPIEVILKNENDELDAFYDNNAMSVSFAYEDTITYLINKVNTDGFGELFDSALEHISNNPRNDMFKIETAGGEKEPLFKKITTKVEATARDNFARAIFGIITQFKFDSAFDGNFDFYATIFEYLIKDYNVASGTYAEYFTPQAVSSIIAKILVGSTDKIDAAEIYDPSAGSGSLILHLAHELGQEGGMNKAIVYTQDISKKSTRFLRLNLVLNGMQESLTNIIRGDTMLHPAHYEIAHDKDSGIKHFDYITSNPPFKLDFSSTRNEIESKWSGTERFFAGVPNIPEQEKDKMAIYLLFIQHILYSLKEQGKAAIVVPTIFLTSQQRSSKIAYAIRQRIIDNSWLKGVITMPSNIFANTGTNVSVLFIDKANTENKIILMDASKLGEKIKIDSKNQKTVLRPEEVNLIIDTFVKAEEAEDFSVLVTKEQIQKKGYSFSAGQYFDVKNEYVDISKDEFENRFNDNSKILEEIYFKYRERVFKEKIALIYNYWFVQFDFPDKNGKPYKTSGGEMEWNKELKMEIPKGWEVKPFNECIESINTGLNPRKNFKLNTGGNIKYLTVKNLTTTGNLNFTPCALVDENARRMIHKRSDIQKGDILFASIAPLGRCYIITDEPKDWDINESVFSIRPNYDNMTSFYLYMTFMSEIFIKRAESNSTGSMFKGIRQNELKNIITIIPPKPLLDKFDSAIEKVFSTKAPEKGESPYLSSLREFLSKC